MYNAVLFNYFQKVIKMATINTRTYTGSTSQVQNTIARIEKLNERAAKKGFDVVIEFSTSEPYNVQTNVHDDYALFPIFEEKQDITVSSRMPLINGWEFVGNIDFSLNPQNPIVLGNDVPEHFRHQHHCDHCNTTRQRNHMFVVKNGNDYKAIGSSCVQDFIQIDVAMLGNAFMQFDDEFGGKGVETYSVESILAITDLVAKHDGYVSKKIANELDKKATSDSVQFYMFTFKKSEAIEIYGRLSDSNFDYAQKVIDNALAKNASDNQYLINLQTMLNAKYIPSKFIGYIVSAYGMYLKDLETQSKKIEYAKGFLGAIKDKIVSNVKIEFIKPIDSNFGVTFLVKMRDTSTNHCLTWFASNCPDFEVNDLVTIKATIKAQQTYQDIDQTVVTRAKVVK